MGDGFSINISGQDLKKYLIDILSLDLNMKKVKLIRAHR